MRNYGGEKNEEDKVDTKGKIQKVMGNSKNVRLNKQKENRL
jgi:hypothetical protein